MVPSAFVRYSDDVEQPSASEAETIGKIIGAMTHESLKVQVREHRAVQASHAKASAFLKATCGC